MPLQIHEKLSHLSQQQIESLVERYISGEKATALIEDYSIATTPSNLVNLLPPTICAELTCPYCENENLVRKITARRSYSSEEPRCPNCGHIESGYCRCSNCQAQAKQQRELMEVNKRRLIHSVYQLPNHDLPPPSDIQLSDAVYLLALFRHSVSEDLRIAAPFSDQLPLFAPTPALRIEIAKYLYRKGFIAPDPDSPLDAFTFDGNEDESPQFYLTRVWWVFLPSLRLAEKRNFLQLLEEIVATREWPEDWAPQINLLWHEIAKYECIEYFEYLLLQRGYELENIGQKTHSVFEGLLKKFSVAQIYNLSWQAVRDTTDYIVREGIPAYRAKNTFIGAVQRKADKYTTEGWELRASRRDFKCPQTVLSSTFFDLFAGLGAKSFETVPPA